MEKTIRVKYLVQEGKRKWIVIVVVGLIVAGLFTFSSYRKTSVAAENVQYASVCSFQISSKNDSSNEVISTVETDLGEMLNRIVKSDDLLMLVSNEVTVIPDCSSKDIRNYIFSQQFSKGRLIEIYVLSGKQELSDEICIGIEKYLGGYLDPYGFKASPVERTTRFGPASISQVQITNSTEKTTTLIPSGIPTFGVATAIKMLLVGFVFGALIAYILVCILYLLKDSAVYEGELEDNSIPIVSVINKGMDCNKALRSSLAGIILTNTNAENITILGCGTNIPEDFMSAAREIDGGQDINLVVCRDIQAEPEELLKIKDADVVSLYVKSDTVKISDMNRVIDKVKESGKSFAGVIFER